MRLARWNHFLLTAGPPIVSRDTLDQLFRPRAKVSELEQYGYGVRVGGTPADPIYFHGGTVLGYKSYNEIRPSSGLSVTLLSNLNTADAELIGHNLASLATG